MLSPVTVPLFTLAFAPIHGVSSAVSFDTAANFGGSAAIYGGGADIFEGDGSVHQRQVQVGREHGLQPRVPGVLSSSAPAMRSPVLAKRRVLSAAQYRGTAKM